MKFTESILEEVRLELVRARTKFPRPQASAHEGFAVLDEERDELWDEVKANHTDRTVRMREEAIQIAAMAVRFVEDVCDCVHAGVKPDAERAAERVLRALGKTELLYAHHGGVNARPEAYSKLAEAFEAYAAEQSGTETNG